MTSEEVKNKKRTSQVVLLAVSVLFIVIFILKFGELSNAIELFSKGLWFFFIAVVGLQILSIINKGALYHSIYDYFGARDTLKRLTLLSVASNFVNLVAPTAGLSGMAIFISEAEHQGMSKSRAIFVNIFTYFLIYTVFTLVLLFGLFYLFFVHQLERYIVISAAILFGVIIVIFVGIMVALGGAARVKNLIGVVAKAVNSIAGFLYRRRVIFRNTDVSLMSEEVHESIKILQNKFELLWLPVVHVLLLEAIDILTLYYLFLAFSYPIYPGVLITLYSVGVLFSLVSITPGGLGVVEATMIVVATGLGLPVELATVVVIGYRIVTFWLPFVLGYFGFRKIQNEKLIRLEHDAS